MRVIEDELASGLHRGRDDAARSYRLALNCALGMLARREHSAVELTEKLRRKSHSRDQVLRVLDHLKTENLQSDERFVEGYVHSRVGRGFGPMHIRNELNRRGISEALVEAKLTRSADFWIAVAQGAVRKRFRHVQTKHVQTKEEEMIARKENEFMDDIDKSATVTSARDHWHRQARFLARRGFPADLIYRVLGGSGR